MPTIKNVTDHVDELHDGRPLPAFESAQIKQADVQDPHYQQRIADGAFLLVEDDKPAPRKPTAPQEEKS